jgi:hypothetical protein
LNMPESMSVLPTGRELSAFWILAVSSPPVGVMTVVSGGITGGSGGMGSVGTCGPVTWTV